MSHEIMKATHDGDLKIGAITIPCAVLEDGTRVLTQAGFLKVLGRSVRPMGIRQKSDAEPLPPFLRGEAINPFISKDLSDSSAPVRFVPKHGGTAYGYRAELLPKVCDVFLRAREAGALPPNQQATAKMCEILVRGLAHIGILALVDEATGYQELRDRKALEHILDKYIGKELAAWAKTFPDEFYQEIFRLRGWEWRGMKVNRPSIVGTLTRDIVYERIAPGVIQVLERKNPWIPLKGRKNKHHQWLTGEFGHPQLKNHLIGVVALMKASTNWGGFHRSLVRAYPKPGDQPEIPLEI